VQRRRRGEGNGWNDVDDGEGGVDDDDDDFVDDDDLGQSYRFRYTVCILFVSF
jgi:hypothetical protein